MPRTKRVEELVLGDVITEIDGEPASNRWHSCTRGKSVTVKALQYAGGGTDKIGVSVATEDGSHDGETFRPRQVIEVEGDED